VELSERGGGGWLGEKRGMGCSLSASRVNLYDSASIKKLFVFKVHNDQQRERDSARAREREGCSVLYYIAPALAQRCHKSPLNGAAFSTKLWLSVH